MFVRQSSVHKLANASSGGDDGDNNAMNFQYQQCVEEIKNEGEIMGSIQLHQEAMRRLKQRQLKEGVPVGPQGRRPSLDDQAYRPKGLSKSQPQMSPQSRNPFLTKNRRLGRSLGGLGKSITRNIASAFNNKSITTNSSDNNRAVKLGGRRESAMPSAFDQDITALVLQDIELSDSDDEEDDDQRLEALVAKIGDSNEKNNKRPSILRRSSSKLRSSFARRTSSVSFESLSYKGSRRSEKSNEGDKKDNKHHRGSSSVSFGSHTSTPSNGESPSKINERDNVKANNLDLTANDVIDHIVTGKELPDVEEREVELNDNKLKDSLPGIDRRKSLRTRRSSLFSVEEERPLTARGDSVTTSFEDNVGNSINNVDSSMQGSNSEHDDAARKGSLICSFGRNSIYSNSNGDDSLICGWESRRSILSNSINSQDGHSHDGASLDISADQASREKSLICGFARRVSIEEINVTIPDTVKAEG